MKNKETMIYSFKATLPVMTGYIILGIGFGILLSSKGYPWWWSTLMSTVVYAGSMQYAAVDLLSGGASLVSAALLTLMVNMRHLFYGVAMLGDYNKAGREKPYLIFALTDETFSLVCSPNLPDGISKKYYYIYTSLFDHIYWVLGSTIGGILGAAITFNAAGVDFAMTALFVVVFVEQWESVKQHFPAVSGIVISVVCLLAFGPSNFVIPSMAGIVLVIFAARRFLKEGENA